MGRLPPGLALAATWVALSVLAVSPVGAASPNTVLALDTGNVGRYSSLELDGRSRPVVSYFDAANSALKLARCADRRCTVVHRATLDPADVGGDTSLALDATGRPIVSYYFGDLDLQTGDLRVAGCPRPACDGTPPRISAPDRAGFTGIGTSIVLDEAGNPVVSYVSIDDGLHVLHCGNPRCTGGNVITPIDPETYGVGTSVALDVDGNPVVAYASFAGLRVAHCADPICSAGTTIQTPASMGSFGWQGGARLALDSAGRPVVSFFVWDASGASLNVLRCGDPSCTSGNLVRELDSDVLVAGRSTPLDTDVVVGASSSIALDAADDPVLAYAGASAPGLRVLRCASADCSSGFTVTTPDPGVDVLDPSMVLDPSGRPLVSYAAEGELRLLRCSTADCSSP